MKVALVLAYRRHKSRCAARCGRPGGHEQEGSQSERIRSRTFIEPCTVLELVKQVLDEWSTDRRNRQWATIFKRVFRSGTVWCDAMTQKVVVGQFQTDPLRDGIQDWYYKDVEYK